MTVHRSCGGWDGIKWSKHWFYFNINIRTRRELSRLRVVLMGCQGDWDGTALDGDHAWNLFIISSLWCSGEPSYSVVMHSL